MSCKKRGRTTGPFHWVCFRAGGGYCKSEMLRTKGVKSARIAERNVKPLSASLEIHGPEAQAEALRQAIAEALPESKPGTCNSQATTAQ